MEITDRGRANKNPCIWSGKKARFLESYIRPHTSFSLYFSVIKELCRNGHGHSRHWIHWKFRRNTRWRVPMTPHGGVVLIQRKERRRFIETLFLQWYVIVQLFSFLKLGRPHDNLTKNITWNMSFSVTQVTSTYTVIKI